MRESALPVSSEVRGACELLGLDAVHVACEGTMVIALPQEAVDASLDILHRRAETRQAARIGEVRAREAAPVIVTRLLGIEQPLDEPLGAPLPRIC